MSAPGTPEISASRLRLSVATVSRSKEWLEMGSSPVTRPDEAPAQLLPSSKLRLRLEACEKDLSIDTSQRDSLREPPTKSTAELSPPLTLVTSENYKVDHCKESLGSPVDSSNNTFEETHLGVHFHEVPDGADESLVTGDTSPVDPNAPFPTPLHVIEVLMNREEAQKGKTKLSSPTWELSALDGDEPELVRYQELESSGKHSDILSASRTHGKSELTSPGVQAPMVASWLQQTTRPPVASFLNIDSRSLNAVSNRCDIDTLTGDLLPVINYPDTQKEYLDGPCRNIGDIVWRQANLTSELRIQRELLTRERLAERLRATVQSQRQEERPPPEEIAWPKARCVIRPATPEDFQGIALIMNLESHKEKRPQLVESRTVGLEDVEFAFNYCRLNSRPFLVAIPGESELLDRSKWPKHAEEDYQEYIKFKEAQAQKSKASPPVLGFAFVTEPRMGPLGGYCSGSRFSGLIKLVVHPDHRQKLYGSALLDRILLSVAVYHRSLVDYKWECSDSALTYEIPAVRNQRKYAKLYLETIFAGQDDPDIEWTAKLLEKFEFKRAACFEQALRTDCGLNSEWLDLVVWELQARPVNEIMDDTPR